MSAFLSLVRLFVRDLVRRKLFWALVVVMIGSAAIAYWTNQQMVDAMGRGESYDLASRRAASNLDDLAGAVRTWLYIAVILLAAQVAPESRKNGTAQFVLSQGVRRDVLAASQLTALALLIGSGVLLIHGGFAVAGLEVQMMSATDIGIGWVALLIPQLAIATAVFAFSLSASAIETYLLFFAVPFVTQTVPSVASQMLGHLPRFAVHAIDSLGLLVPWFADLTPWPHATFEVTRSAPHAAYGWHVVHVALAMSFWIAIGIWRHRHHDFGSRSAVK